ncbi:MAG: substrate-binding domain-containing protein [Spirochaetales bacterium]|nr:substrate-binding domain-containing protein [Spirochaetales bacterium]
MNIGFVLDNLNEEYQNAIYSGIVKEAEKHSISIVCIQTNTFYRKTNPLLQIFDIYRGLPVQAYIVLSSLYVDFSQQQLSESIEKFLARKPVVFIGGKSSQHVSITVSIKKALGDLVRHLVIDHGYRRFLYFGGSEYNYDNISRISVIKSTLAALRRQKQYQDIHLVVKNGDLFTETNGYNLAREYCRMNPERNCDVLMAGSDHMAVGVMTYLKSHAGPSWQDCPVTGFDDIPDAILQTPPLTTVGQPLDEIGSAAVLAVISLLDHRRLPGKIYVESKLIIRESCSCNTTRAIPSSLRESRLNLKRIFQAADKFGQILMDAKTFEELRQPLDYFLDELDIKIFHLVLFGMEHENGVNNYDLLFSRVQGRLLDQQEGYQFTDLDFFLSSVINGADQEPFHYYVFQLRAGNDLLGFILFGARGSSYLAISYRSVYLSNIIRRIQLFEKDQAYTRDLEKLVELRSRKLAEEMARRIEVEAEVLRISELERQRFSMDIHDDICQRLASISLMCRGLVGREPQLGRVTFLLDETLQLTRQYAYTSFPIDLDAIGLGNALQQLCIEIEEHSGIPCSIIFEGDIPNRFGTRETINIYRIIQEALHNSVKHAKASKLSLVCTCTADVSSFIIKDDGKGNPEIMKTTSPVQKGRRPRGLGLRSMQYRADQLNAEFSIVSSKTGGTVITLNVPLVMEKKNG